MNKQFTLSLTLKVQGYFSLKIVQFTKTKCFVINMAFKSLKKTHSNKNGVLSNSNQRIYTYSFKPRF